MLPMDGLGLSAQQEDIAATLMKLVEEFFEFSKSKLSIQDNKLNHLSKKNLNTVKELSIQDNRLNHLSKKNLNTVKESHVDSQNFKEKLVFYFGNYFPTIVIDELCAVVQDNSYGKCSYCAMPTESLVLSVLQILVDAGSKKGEAVDKDAHVCTEADRTMHRSAQGGTYASMLLRTGRNDKENVKNQTTTQDAFDNLMGKLKNSVPVVDTPVVMKNNSCHTTEFVSDAEPYNPMNKRIKLERPISHGSGLASDDPINVDCMQNRDSTSHQNLRQNSKVSCDEIYNRKNFPASEIRKKVDARRSNLVGNEPSNITTKTSTISTLQGTGQASCQFHVSDEERRYYDVFCGLAHSQWKCFPAVKFSKTSVTYSSFGESIEPNGLVDNFFISCWCRKLFEDNHPRRSKRHYFYPYVGGALLTYNCDYDVNVVKNSFQGANSAHRLHLSDKLCFPVWKQDHWFAFIVDLRNKKFVFLDSIYDRDSDYQTSARGSLITSFSECWYEYADVKLDLDGFSIEYPPVPKQQNVYDCGIFTIKFMELWDNSVDLRQLFGPSDIPNIRIKLGMSLFFSKSNSADMSIVRQFYQQGINPGVCID